MAAPGAAPGAALDASLAAINHRLDVISAKVDALPTLAQIEALLAPANVPTLAAAASLIVQKVAHARALNAHDRGPLVAVPTSSGAAPAHWPIEFNRSQLFLGSISTVDSLLTDYGLPIEGADEDIRRNMLASYIGTPRL